MMLKSSEYERVFSKSILDFDDGTSVKSVLEIFSSLQAIKQMRKPAIRHFTDPEKKESITSFSALMQRSYRYFGT